MVQLFSTLMIKLIITTTINTATKTMAVISYWFVTRKKLKTQRLSKLNRGTQYVRRFKLHWFHVKLFLLKFQSDAGVGSILNSNDYCLHSVQGSEKPPRKVLS